LCTSPDTGGKGLILSLGVAAGDKKEGMEKEIRATRILFSSKPLLGRVYSDETTKANLIRHNTPASKSLLVSRLRDFSGKPLPSFRKTEVLVDGGK